MIREESKVFTILDLRLTILPTRSKVANRLAVSQSYSLFNWYSLNFEILELLNFEPSNGEAIQIFKRRSHSNSEASNLETAQSPNATGTETKLG